MGPLTGKRFIEMKGLGPCPYAGMLLADMGAEVIVVDRIHDSHAKIGPSSVDDLHSRGKRSIALNLKSKDGLNILLSLIDRADAIFEGYRPGVAERLGFGPDICLQRNPKLVYGRMTGWGQNGPLAHTAGHDINYISLTGALAAIGPEEQPAPPLNLVGDYAGGSLFLVMGMLAALLEAEKSGVGQVVDAAITDGTASLMTVCHSLAQLGMWSTQRAANILDGGAHFYNTYKTSDGKFVSIGSIEPQFYALLFDKLGLDPRSYSDKDDSTQWPSMKRMLADIFRTKTRDEWCSIMEGSDVCFAPVLNFEEAVHHPHNVSRRTYIQVDGVTQPGPAPRFSRTNCDVPVPPQAEGADTESILSELGFSAEDVGLLKQAGMIG